jgi:WD40 repeat protein
MDLIQTNQGSISQVSFVPKTNELLTSGYDGRLVHWKRAGQSNAIADIGQPIDRFSVVNQGSDIVLGSIDGTLWRVEPSGQRHILRQGSSRVTQIVPLADTHLYVGYTNGDIVEIDTRSWTQNIVIRAARSVRQIVTQGEAIAIATNSDVSYFRPPPANAHTSSVHWMTLPDHVSSFTFSDDLLVAVCIDGAVWLYSMSHEKWIYLATGGMNLGWVTAADDGATAAAMDTEGHIVWLDLELAHELFRRGT